MPRLGNEAINTVATIVFGILGLAVALASLWVTYRQPRVHRDEEHQHPKDHSPSGAMRQGLSWLPDGLVSGIMGFSARLPGVRSLFRPRRPGPDQSRQVGSYRRLFSFPLELPRRPDPAYMYGCRDCGFAANAVLWPACSCSKGPFHVSPQSTATFLFAINAITPYRIARLPRTDGVPTGALECKQQIDEPEPSRGILQFDNSKGGVYPHYITSGHWTASNQNLVFIHGSPLLRTVPTRPCSCTTPKPIDKGALASSPKSIRNEAINTVATITFGILGLAVALASLWIMYRRSKPGPSPEDELEQQPTAAYHRRLCDTVLHKMSSLPDRLVTSILGFFAGLPKLWNRTPFRPRSSPDHRLYPESLQLPRRPTPAYMYGSSLAADASGRHPDSAQNHH
ncbi:hypothetical protein CPLU01_12708 [Colletotrichum plurivorum]|uniref:Uncharacterized protein n=1 Tax=Colletotrichum plurivorum TaxID=2175906 RepID=A0A8H6JWH8_9PEZI|nr:hypothetical protein CPLU01_12708 [Colletotrichum plurivorum]